MNEKPSRIEGFHYDHPRLAGALAALAALVLIFFFVWLLDRLTGQQW